MASALHPDGSVHPGLGRYHACPLPLLICAQCLGFALSPQSHHHPPSLPPRETGLPAPCPHVPGQEPLRRRQQRSLRPLCPGLLHHPEPVHRGKSISCIPQTPEEVASSSCCQQAEGLLPLKPWESALWVGTCGVRTTLGVINQQPDLVRGVIAIPPFIRG